ncbi:MULTISPECIES: Fur-regulated basic protein FbpA [unclassified Rummeliibacillus]|uniref:Fur-regulated basic protein FbpA n=1 Tax=unclassified Rummeliibacillus TaxID=2622809 RepID=UPI000E6662E8|nr:MULTISPECIES: Fur-regulated basic protein FbpA [unclassified Rummeliibacillus]RIJ68860.1 Fur-regulated basic protein FbpA [Rummeliibacillus sp. POC4]RPJ95917.1 Fur-regulated basic protein FbpA [Rummeliibacillus sp. TYF005]
MNNKKITAEERKKNHIIDHLMNLGVFKVNDKQLYQVSLEELMKEYKKHIN